jgi:hypothetical protein
MQPANGVLPELGLTRLTWLATHIRRENIDKLTDAALLGVPPWKARTQQHRRKPIGIAS